MCMAVVAFESVLHQAKVDIEDEVQKFDHDHSNDFGCMKMVVCEAYGSPPRPQSIKDVELL